ncbi:MAG: hypothetical protein QOK49_1079 [Baekduia sp.]|nr:hypothetical protein [Baekduia sp.]
MSCELSPAQIALGLLASIGVGGGALAGMTIAGGLYSGASNPTPATAVPPPVAPAHRAAASPAQSAGRIATHRRAVRVSVAPRRPVHHHRASPSAPAVVRAVAAPVTPASRVRTIAPAARRTPSTTGGTSAPIRTPAPAPPTRSNPVVSASPAPRPDRNPAPAAAPAPARTPAPSPKPKAQPKPQAIGAFDDSG